MKPEQKLLPCPFCGGKAKYDADESSVYCTQCLGQVTDFTLMKRDLFSAWNTRVDSGQTEALNASHDKAVKFQRTYVGCEGRMADEINECN